MQNRRSIRNFRFLTVKGSKKQKKVQKFFFEFLTPFTVKNRKFRNDLPVLHLLSRFQNFFQNLKIPTTAEMATENVCVHLTFTILSLLSMSFLISLQSKFGNFETSYSVTFCLKISELFFKTKNSNYSQYGGSKRICNKTEIFFQFPQKGPMRS